MESNNKGHADTTENDNNPNPKPMPKSSTDDDCSVEVLPSWIRYMPTPPWRENSSNLNTHVGVDASEKVIDKDNTAGNMKSGLPVRRSSRRLKGTQPKQRRLLAQDNPYDKEESRKNIQRKLKKDVSVTEATLLFSYVKSE